MLYDHTVAPFFWIKKLVESWLFTAWAISSTSNAYVPAWLIVNRPVVASKEMPEAATLFVPVALIKVSNDAADDVESFVRVKLT
jgi:hypothetical protein